MITSQSFSVDSSVDEHLLQPDFLSLYRLDILEERQRRVNHYYAAQTIVRRVILGEHCAQIPALFQRIELYQALPMWVTEAWATQRNTTLADLVWTGAVWVTHHRDLQHMRDHLMEIYSGHRQRTNLLSHLGAHVGSKKMVYVPGKEVERLTQRKVDTIERKLREKRKNGTLTHDRGFVADGKIEVQSWRDLWKTLEALLSAPENMPEQMIPEINAGAFRCYNNSFLQKEEEYFAVGFRYDLK